MRMHVQLAGFYSSLLFYFPSGSGDSHPNPPPNCSLSSYRRSSTNLVRWPAPTILQTILGLSQCETDCPTFMMPSDISLAIQKHHSSLPSRTMLEPYLPISTIPTLNIIPAPGGHNGEGYMSHVWDREGWTSMTIRTIPSWFIVLKNNVGSAWEAGWTG